MFAHSKKGLYNRDVTLLKRGFYGFATKNK